MAKNDSFEMYDPSNPSIRELKEKQSADTMKRIEPTTNAAAKALEHLQESDTVFDTKKHTIVAGLKATEQTTERPARMPSVADVLPSSQEHETAPQDLETAKQNTIALLQSLEQELHGSERSDAEKEAKIAHLKELQAAAENIAVISECELLQKKALDIINSDDAPPAEIIT